MKKMNKLIVILVVIALTVPMLFTTATASAKETAKSIFDSANKAAKKVHSLDIDMSFNFDMDKMGGLSMTCKGAVKDNPVGADLTINLDMSSMVALFKAIGQSNVNADDLKMKIKTYAESTDDGFYVYFSLDNGTNWIKTKVAEASEMDKATKINIPAFNKQVEKFKVKTGKGNYTLSGDVSITPAMVQTILNNFQFSANQIDKKTMKQITSMFKGSKAVKVSMTIDSKTYLPSSIKVDATNMVNSLISNLGKVNKSLAGFAAMLKVKDCSFTMKMSNYDNQNIVVPEDVKANAVEQSVSDNVDSVKDAA